MVGITMSIWDFKSCASSIAGSSTARASQAWGHVPHEAHSKPGSKVCSLSGAFTRAFGGVKEDILKGGGEWMGVE